MPNLAPGESAMAPEKFSDRYTLLFTSAICVVCGIILSVLASSLSAPQKEAKDLDQHEQMLIAAKMLAPEHHFLVQDASGAFMPANFDKATKQLKICSDIRSLRQASSDEIESIHQLRIKAVLIDSEGKSVDFESDLAEKLFVDSHQKLGYAQLPQKLVYLLLPNLPAEQLNSKTAPAGYLLPINGAGLWGPIYGYLALQRDGDTVLGTTWYLQGETPGLGANISEPSWQKQFVDKKVFQRASDGSVDDQKSPLGIMVVKGKVIDIFGKTPLALSAVDGMSGATLTGNGVTAAYKDVLTAYRPFLATLRKESTATKGAP